MRIVAVNIFTLAFTLFAHAADVDWKLYGTDSVDGVVCFYDAGGITHRPEGLVRVWTKCLLMREIDAIEPNSSIGKKIIEDAATKIVLGYVPPVVAIEKNAPASEAIATVAGAEEIAKLSDIRPSARFYYEISCSERMIRRLSTYIVFEGKVGFSDKPSDWAHVPPEGSGANIVKLLCPG